MREYDIYIPAKASDGTPLDPALLERIKARLMEAYGGYTHMTQEMEGGWKVGGVAFLDAVTILRVLDEGTGPVLIAELKEAIRQELKQKEVLVIERAVRVA